MSGGGERSLGRLLRVFPFSSKRGNLIDLEKAFVVYLVLISSPNYEHGLLASGCHEHFLYEANKKGAKAR